MDEQRKIKKPVNYDELYPGRFIKAGELLGKKVMLTISDIDLEELVGDQGPQVKCIISFRETQKKHVAPKTNAICLKKMWGKSLEDWKGKRVFLFESTWNGEPCLRVWGSPDIPEELEVEIALPRRRPFRMVMHRTNNASGNGATTRTAEYLSAMTGSDIEHEEPRP